MWRFDTPARVESTDRAHFLDVLNARAPLFETDAPLHVARAPGRLDLMGGIADYSGSLVLQWPLAVACYVAAQRAAEPLCTVETTLAGPGADPRVLVSLTELVGDGRPGYAEARALLTASPARRWVAYVLGALVVLAHDRGLNPGDGVRVLIHSEVPPGAGVASSAALEVAAMRALAAAYGLEVDGWELALLCQRAENLVVGAPCGVMDQMTAALGEPSRLLCLLCQPAALCPPVPLPPEVEVWGIDSGVRHDVAGADYGQVRTGAFMGYRVVAELAGLAATPLGEGQGAIEDRAGGGYLANVPPSVWEGTYRDRVPESFSGAEFLARYGGITDAVTRVDPERTYAVRHPTAHPIHEHHRVRLFRALLDRGRLDEEACAQLGELMYASHASYGACGLGSAGTDRLVELVREAGRASGLWGAKITGGGSGGTVAVLARRGARAAVKRVAGQYARENGRSALVLEGSSSGAVPHGVLRAVAD